MKTILVPLDFSGPSENAARYALHLAKFIKANILLCHAVYIPVEVPTESFGSWPGYDTDTLKEEGIQDLEKVARKLRDREADYSVLGNFQPEITCTAECGAPVDVIKQIAQRSKISMIVMGMTGAGPAARLLFGSISRKMIDQTTFPLILVPEGLTFDKIKKICFATDLADDDINSIHAIAGLAKYLDADLLVAHAWDGNSGGESHQRMLNNFINDVTCKINYDKLYFRQVGKSSIDKGLEWLIEHGLIDLFVMVHREKGLFASLFISHTHVVANHLHVPLLVMPSGSHPVF
jgi:nucleotide-binding universal stress UspA family protein